MSAAISASPFRVTVLATGGTIEKTYDPVQGALTLDVPVLERLLATLSQPDIEVRVERVMARDSLDMTDDHRALIVAAVVDVLAREEADAIVITHGTDTLADTARTLFERLETPVVPVVLTGAMVPYRVSASDAAQNVAQALMACRLLAPGFYAVMHSRAIAASRVVKDYHRLTLVESGGDA